MPNQFEDAEAFVTGVLANNSGVDYSFTGHSLGGGLAQYMTYKTGVEAVTFNAVGIAQLVTTLAKRLRQSSKQFSLERAMA